MLSLQDQHTTATAQAATGAGEYRGTFSWTLRSMPVMRFLFATTTVFLTVSLLGQWFLRDHPTSDVAGKVMRATNVGLEGNLPSLYNAALLLACALLLGLLASGSRPCGTADARGWRLLTWVFAYLTADEYLHFHEMLTAPMRGLLRVDGLLHYAWVVPYAVLGIILFVNLLPFLRRLPGRVFRNMLIAGAVYIAGAMGLEMIGGKVDTLFGENSLALVILSTIEEGLEMFALTFFIGVLIGYVREQRPDTTLNVALTPEPGTI
ncbi:hypothetical protein [Deinococcus sp.]|uniref:hypothetical protein n=1 Tax=Deinococcus sp. TaxID=47478 RepID=UPI0028698E44|nr:hypothetical protein [Deinococcus sp.]